MLVLWLVVATLSVDRKELKWPLEWLVKGDGHLPAGMKPLETYLECYVDEVGSNPDAEDQSYAGAYCTCKTGQTMCSMYQEQCRLFYNDEGGVQDQMSSEVKDLAKAFCKGVCDGSDSRPKWCPLSTGAIVGIVIAAVVVVGVVVAVLVYFLVIRKKSDA
jgi:hypothetical protein